MTPDVAADFGRDPGEVKDIKIFEGKGCTACNFTGYSGRRGVYEFLLLDEAVRQLIMARAPASSIKEAALKAGMRTMLQDGWRKVQAGVTSPSEILRVIREDG